MRSPPPARWPHRENRTRNTPISPATASPCRPTLRTMLDSTNHDTSDGAYSLREPLPSDVVVRSPGSLGDYRNYPVFSAPWFRRRTAIFAPGAAGMGLMQSLLLGASFSDWSLAARCAVVGIPIWIVIVTAGPALATLVRHSRLRSEERRLGQQVRC